MAGTGAQEARYDFLDVIIVGTIFVFFIMPLTAYGLLVFWPTIKEWAWLGVFVSIPIYIFIHSCVKTYRINKAGANVERVLNGVHR